MIDDVVEQKKIVRIYAAFGASLILSLVPLVIAAGISLLLGLGVLVIAYVLRTDTEEGSLTENHMTFIIRTIWIGCFVSLITMMVASLYLFQNLDNTPLQVCANDILNTFSNMTAFEPETLERFLDSACFIDYWRVNIRTFVISGVMAAGPVLLYFFVRYTRGFTRATRGYRVANPNSWF
jgi:uncharacterized membrane protein